LFGAVEREHRLGAAGVPADQAVAAGEDGGEGVAYLAAAVQPAVVTEVDFLLGREDVVVVTA
jgi:hypothetical protein